MRQQKVAPAAQMPAPKRSTGQQPVEPEGDGVKLKKEIGLVSAVSLIVGTIVGSGIFVSPKGVLKHSQSIGCAIVVWILSGLLSLVGALCYAELGTMIPKSGGDYAYILEAFSPLPAFLYLWVALFIIVPTGNAVTALTFAQYVLQPIWATCQPPYEAVRLVAAIITCLLTVINCYNVKSATRVQDVFTATKVFALLIIIISGIYWLCMGHTQNFNAPFESTNTQLGHMTLAMYSGLFSYAGWNCLNFVTEELKDPYKNLPWAISISLPVVTIIYVLTNVAYFAVLEPWDILSSQAVAVTFGEKLLGAVAWSMPLFVACSTFGALNGAIFASARLFFVGARNGHLPTSIALINIKNLTPMPSLIFLCLITLVLLVIDDIYSLINYVTFAESLFTTTSVAGLLWLRYKRPDLHRPIKVHIILPILFFIICIFLCVTPCIESPWEVGIATGLILSGVPVYYVCIAWKNKPKWLVQGSDAINVFCMKLFMCVEEDKTD